MRDDREGQAVAGGVRPARTSVLIVLGHGTDGGTRVFVDILRSELADLGVEVETLALAVGDELGAIELGYPTLYPRRRIGSFGYVHSLFYLAALMRRKRFDAVIAVMPVTNVVACMAARISGVRCRIATHHTPREALSWVTRSLHAIAQAADTFTDIICVSSSVRDSFRAPIRHPHSIKTIPNGVRIDIAPRCDDSPTADMTGGTASVKFVYVGRLSEEKNVMGMLRSFAGVRGAHLYIIGDGPLRSEVENFVTSNGMVGHVSVVGALHRDQALVLMRDCDVFVQLSFFEGRSFAMLEAITLGLCVIASDIPSQRELLAVGDDRQAGMLVEPGNHEAVRAAMQMLVDDPDLRRDMRARAEIVATGASSRTMAMAYLNTIMDRLSASERARSMGA